MAGGRLGGKLSSSGVLDRALGKGLDWISAGVQAVGGALAGVGRGLYDAGKALGADLAELGSDAVDLIDSMFDAPEAVPAMAGAQGVQGGGLPRSGLSSPGLGSPGTGGGLGAMAAFMGNPLGAPANGGQTLTYLAQNDYGQDTMNDAVPDLIPAGDGQKDSTGSAEIPAANDSLGQLGTQEERDFVQHVLENKDSVSLADKSKAQQILVDNGINIGDTGYFGDGVDGDFKGKSIAGAERFLNSDKFQEHQMDLQLDAIDRQFVGLDTDNNEGLALLLRVYENGKNSSDEDIKRTQTYLSERNHYLGTSGENGDGVDGIYGGRTTRALAEELGYHRIANSEDGSIGSVAALSESGFGNLLSPGSDNRISTGVGDPGGPSYGRFQISSLPNGGTMRMFLESEYGRPYGDMELSGYSINSDEFKEIYQFLANTDSDFNIAQRNFLMETHVNPALDRARELGFNVDDPGVREAIFSGSIQHGGINAILTNTANSGELSSMSSEQQLTSYYAEREGYALYYSGTDATEGITNRMNRELRQTLGISRAYNQFYN